MHTILARRHRYGVLLLSLLLHLGLLLLLLCSTYDFDHLLFDMSRNRPGTPAPAVVHFVNPGNTTAQPTQATTAPQLLMPAPSSVAPAQAPVADTGRVIPSAGRAPHASPPVEPKPIEKITQTPKNNPRTTPLVSQPTSADYARSHALKKTAAANTHTTPTSTRDALSMANIVRACATPGADGIGGTGNIIDPEVERRMIVLHRYGKKVYDWLSQSFRGHYRLIHLCKDLNTKCQMIMSFAKDGTFLDLKINHSHKTEELKEIESILFKTAKVAGLFPKIPASLQTDQITLSFDFDVNVKEGFHPYDLLYR